MSYDSKVNRGVLFKNDRKRTETHPDYKGEINIDGVEFWLSAWIQKSRQGETYMSLSIGDAKGEKPSAKQPARHAAPDADFDNEIPF